MLKYYLDTSIWLDFFENRDEPNLPKGRWAYELLDKITKTSSKIIISDLVIYELGNIGYSSYEINTMFKPIRDILIFVDTKEKQTKRAKDLSAKRKIPKADALHALIARDNKAILITLDKHFQKLQDIIKPKRSQAII